MSTPHFHALKVREVRRETADAISVSFDVPEALRGQYRFTQGQFVTLRAEIGGEDLRRAYSICCSVADYERDGTLRVGIKRVADGRFSNWANDTLAAGATLDVMTPDGRFFTELDPRQTRHYVGIAGGSGITPMISLIETTLEVEPHSTFTLVYGNRDTRSIMFLEEIEGLKNRYMTRFQRAHVLSDEAQEIELLNGLLDRARCESLLEALAPAERFDHAFVCGPAPMMDAAEAALQSYGLEHRQISIERFGTPGTPAAAPRAVPVDASAPAAEVTLVVDGKSRTLRVPFEGPAILDAGIEAGSNLPYSCKNGVCCTCRARVLEGEVRMDRNYSLEDWELERGFVLTCQAHPVSARVRISYDER